MKEQKKLVKWIKEHKRELIAVGISVGALLLLALGIKNKDQVKKLYQQLRELIKPTSIEVAKEIVVAFPKSKAEAPTEVIQSLVSTVEPLSAAVQKTIFDAESAHKAHEAVEHASFMVNKHPRTLPAGWNASPEKIATALENGFDLKANQTWVISYPKGGKTA